MDASDRDNHIDFIEFPAADPAALAQAKAFYQSVFGWAYQDWGDEYCDTTGSGVGSGLNADPSHRPQHPLAVVYVADLGAARARVLAAQGVITREVFSFPGGRRFHFMDPAGNELAVWSDR